MNMNSNFSIFHGRHMLDKATSKNPNKKKKVISRESNTKCLVHSLFTQYRKTYFWPSYFSNSCFSITDFLQLFGKHTPGLLENKKE